MKKFMFSFFVFSSFSLFALEESRDLQVMTITTLSQVDLDVVLNQADENIVIEFPAGTIVPLKFFLKSDLITFIGEEKRLGQLKAESTFYVRLLRGEEFLFSLDLIEWKSILDFFTGRADIALSIEEKIPSITFGVEANQRK